MQKIVAGQILLAQPFMRDPYFSRKVLLLCEHTKSGSAGFILNKEVDVPLNSLLASFPPFDVPVHFGGPVQNDTMHYIHTLGHLFEDSRKIADGLWWGGNYEKLKTLVRQGLVPPNRIRFFVGYSGWGVGQLSSEMRNGSWVPADLNMNYVFNPKTEDLWEKVMYDKGNSYQIISKIPSALLLN